MYQNSQSKKRSCKWRVRYFYSKGAFLVILWNFLINIVLLSQLLIVVFHHKRLPGQSTNSYLLSIPLGLLALLSFPISGWLADAKYGKYKVFKTGIATMFLSTVIGCVNTLAQGNVASLMTLVTYCIVVGLLTMGFGTCFATAAQLGLDQMPDASSENITSFIAWYVLSFVAGSWVSVLLNTIVNKCVNRVFQLVYIQIWSFFIVVCMSTVLITNYLLAPKWLIVEPKSPQALRNIYQVLKFAIKHKFPINRSALTYWEEEIPSRLDLGKSKYGGPFTTEQVEDVKTILRILVASIPICLFYAIATLKPLNEIERIPNLSRCASNLVYYFSYSGSWCFFLCTILQEFVVYPLTRGRLPTTLTKIEAASFAFTLMVVICLILTILDYTSIIVSTWAVRVIFLISGGCVYQVLMTSILEFVCAQSPYNMRGLLVGYIFVLFGIWAVASYGFSIFFVPWCNIQDSCVVFLWSAFSASCILIFLLICCASRKYKRRVRDDQYFAQAVIEEIYDRRLTAAAAQYKSYQTLNN